MLSSKEKVALDKYLTTIPEETENKSELRTNDLGQTLEYFQDDNGATVAHSDTVYRLSIKTELKRMHFLVLFESAQELLDEFQQELVTASLSKYSDGKSFIKEMEGMFGE
ncbi:hypothetical protein P7D73_21770 [Enterococcus raffinosus]|uniref:hypothetical protein n=1 Tax=Enterococcus raffinosus TaxID=71452 RepID=UPI0028927E59|nr:hypothetical protein [Enterococcus raffinosus]MDT2525892.1 hypothetical protein [Enterococcus raffinosus]MDT2536400.1 hypothetical protein [Enterococcus raffinosus]MDT2593174.1 hypothetical protein [Enterococcus raffinosus]